MGDEVRVEEMMDEPAAVELDENETLKQLRQLALRASLGKSEKLPLLFPVGDGEWKPIDDPRFWVVFNDPPADAIDAFQDAMEQYRTSGDMELDEETGKVIGTPEVERRNRMWPVIRVLVEFKLIDSAQLPQFDGQGNLIIYKWKSSRTQNLENLQRGGLLTVACLVHMANDFILNAETQRVVDGVGE